MNYTTKDYPDEGQIILAKIEKIEEHGMYGVCIDFPRLKIFLSVSEISKKRLNYQKIFSPVKKYPLQVLDVDTTNDVAYVSYSKVTEDEKKLQLEKHENNERVYDMGKDIVKYFKEHIPNADAELIFRYTVQMFIETTEVVNSYHDMLNSPEKLFANLKNSEYYENNTEKQLINTTMNDFVSAIKQRITINPLVMTAKFIVIVLAEDAIGNIKKILTENIDTVPNAYISYCAGSKYKATVEAMSKEEADSKINAIYEIIQENCKRYNGSFKRDGDNIIQKDKQYSFTRLYIVD